MRHAFAFAILAALWAGTALADEPAACYVKSDPTGDFVPEKVKTFNADPQTGAQIVRLMNEDNRAIARCMKGYFQREGGAQIGDAGILYGARISPAGKVIQVSVLQTKNINDGMLMACIARSVCEWQLEASPDGQERLVSLPPHVVRGRMGLGARNQ